MLVGDDASKQPGGAVLAKQMASPNNIPNLVISDPNRMWDTGLIDMHGDFEMRPVWRELGWQVSGLLGAYNFSNNAYQWTSFHPEYEYYMAIIEKRY